MTEAEWRASADPAAMLAWRLSWPASERKMRLVALAMAGDGDRHQFEDGGTFDILAPTRSWPWLLRWQASHCPQKTAAASAIRDVFGDSFPPATLEPACVQCGGGGREHGFGLTGYSRPCRSCPPLGDGTYRGSGLGPASVLTPAVASVARAAYMERDLPSQLDNDRLAVLSDALEECGASEAVLLHLRSPGLHVPGCWALDLVLGKS